MVWVWVGEGVGVGVSTPGHEIFMFVCQYGAEEEEEVEGEVRRRRESGGERFGWMAYRSLPTGCQSY